MTTIDMSECLNAEIVHELDAIETSQKWHKTCRQLREDGVIQ